MIPRHGGLFLWRQARQALALKPLFVYVAMFDELDEEAKKSPGFRFSHTTLIALQQAFEIYMIGIMEDACACATHGKRVTVMEKDLYLAMRLRGEAYDYKM